MHPTRANVARLLQEDIRAMLWQKFPQHTGRVWGFSFPQADALTRNGWRDLSYYERLAVIRGLRIAQLGDGWSLQSLLTAAGMQHRKFRRRLQAAYKREMTR